MSTKTVDYARWRKLIYKVQLIAAFATLIAEIIINTILYVTRSQGYGPETIVSKLLRYLLLTSLINFGSIIAGRIILSRIPENSPRQRYVLVMTIEAICIDVAYSHYQFGVTLGIFVIPLSFCILYEDFKLHNITLAVSIAGLLAAAIARGLDPVYNTDIVAETIIAFTILLVFSFFARLIINVLKENRQELLRIQKEAEKAKYVDELNKKNAELAKEKERLNDLTRESILALSNAVEFNDHYTNGHLQRVANYSKLIAEKMELSHDKITEIYYAGLLHDVGKLGINNEIINKPERLNDEEYETIKQHTPMGYKILRDMSEKTDFKDLSNGAKWHHERFDGTGYPDKLKGTEIPLIARIIAVADSYDAMTSTRSYRQSMNCDQVRQELIDGKGTQFDPEIIDIMLELLDEGKINGR